MDYNPQALSAKLATANRYAAGLTQEVITYLEGRGISHAVAEQFKLGVCDDIHSGWLSIPYLRPGGVIHINYRNMQPGAKPKYAAPGEKHLYNTADLDIADQTGEIAICEGEIDTISASACYGVPAVGIPGSTQWTGNRHWRELFTGYQRVWVLADPDDAGMKLAIAILEALPNARLAKLPCDVNDMLVSGESLKGYLK